MHVPTETPMEYGLRLTRHFPTIKNEIMVIVDMFNREIYGETKLFSEELEKTRMAVSTLQSPSHWPLRLKTRLNPSARSMADNNFL